MNGSVERTMDLSSGVLREVRTVREWTSNKARLERCRARLGGSSVDVVLKSGFGWTAADAAGAADSFDRLAASFADQVDIVAPEAVGWASQPPTVVLPYVEGIDVKELILDRHEGIVDVLARCGAALALYHEAHVVEDPARRVAALNELDEVARWTLVRRRRVHAAALRAPVVEAFGDFMPNNVRLAPDGRLWVLDAPTATAASVVHRDVAWFIRMTRGLCQPEARGRAPRSQGEEEALVGAFLDGYATRGVDLRRGSDRWLLAVFGVYRDLATVRKRWRTGKRAEIAGWVRQVVRARAQLPRTGLRVDVVPVQELVRGDR